MRRKNKTVPGCLCPGQGTRPFLVTSPQTKTQTPPPGRPPSHALDWFTLFKNSREHRVYRRSPGVSCDRMPNTPSPRDSKCGKERYLGHCHDRILRSSSLVPLCFSKTPRHAAPACLGRTTHGRNRAPADYTRVKHHATRLAELLNDATAQTSSSHQRCVPYRPASSYRQS